MAIYGIGAFFDEKDDVSRDFISKNLAGIERSASDAPELHEFIKTLKVGDIIYIKSCVPNKDYFSVLAIGFIRDDAILDAQSTRGFVQAGRNVDWKVRKEFPLRKPKEKNNVRLNSLYQEFHPEVQAEILNKLMA